MLTRIHRALCIDHGTKKMGWGVVDIMSDGSLADIASGVFNYSDDARYGGRGWVLAEANRDIIRVMTLYSPTILLMEEQSSQRNADTTRQLLWLQGVVLLGAWQADVNLPVEFVHRSTVQRVVGGKGGCLKSEVIKGVNTKFGLGLKAADEDRADALALGITYPVWLAEKPAREEKKRVRKASAAAKRTAKRAAGSGRPSDRPVRSTPV